MQSRSLPLTILYNLIRLAPCAAFLMISGIPSYGDPDALRTLVERLVVLVAVIAVWTMAEGAVMLWYRMKRDKPGQSRGYGFVCLMIGFMSLGMLHLFRVRSTQLAFIILLVSLSLRGMGRSGWEQNRPHVGFAGSWASAAAISLVSILGFTETLAWPAFVFAFGLGGATAAVEAAWYAGDRLIDAVAKWQVPAFRAALVAGPLATATLGFMGQLPLCYTIVLIAIPFSIRVVKLVTAKGFVGEFVFRPTLAAYGVFMAAVLFARAYERGWLS